MHSLPSVSAAASTPPYSSGNTILARAPYTGDAAAASKGTRQNSAVPAALPLSRASDATRISLARALAQEAASSRGSEQIPPRHAAARRSDIAGGREANARLPVQRTTAERPSQRRPCEQTSFSSSTVPARGRPQQQSSRRRPVDPASGASGIGGSTHTRQARASARNANTIAERPGSRMSTTSRASAASEAQMVADQEMLMMEALACSLEEEDNQELLMRHLLTQSDEASAARQQAPAGVDQVLLSMLPITEWLGSSTDGCDECPLCICEYEVGERIMRLPCLHSAHEECLSEWLGRCKQCPVCKLDAQETLAAMRE